MASSLVSFPIATSNRQYMVKTDVIHRNPIWLFLYHSNFTSCSIFQTSNITNASCLFAIGTGHTRHESRIKHANIILYYLIHNNLSQDITCYLYTSSYAVYLKGITAVLLRPNRVSTRRNALV